MSVRTKDLLLKYGLSALAGLILFSIHMILNYSNDLPVLEKYHVLCDAFSIPGILLVCFGFLLFASSLGALDGVGYGIMIAFKMLIPGKNRKNPEKYGDYLDRKRNSRAKGFWPVIYVGLIYLAIAILFLVKFYAVL